MGFRETVRNIWENKLTDWAWAALCAAATAALAVYAYIKRAGMLIPLGIALGVFTAVMVAYAAFRAIRFYRVKAGATPETIERNVRDWLYAIGYQNQPV